MPVFQSTLYIPFVSYWQKYVHEVLVNRLGGLSLHRKSVVRLTDRPDMTLDVYRGRKTTMQYNNSIYQSSSNIKNKRKCVLSYIQSVHRDISARDDGYQLSLSSFSLLLKYHQCL